MQPRGLPFLLSLAISIWGLGLVQAPDAVSGPQDGNGGHGISRSAEKKGKNQEQAVKRSLHMEEIEIHGDVEKPKTMFVIPRSSLRYTRRNQEKDFTNEILNPISREWIEDTQRWRAAVPPP